MSQLAGAIYDTPWETPERSEVGAESPSSQ